MKKGLGSIPKGLAWINSKKEPTKEIPKKNSSSARSKIVKTSQQGLNRRLDTRNIYYQTTSL